MVGKWAKWAPLGAALCLVAAAGILCLHARRDARSIYRMLHQYD